MKIWLIGPGRAGRALARAWRAAGLHVELVVGRRREAAGELAASVGARALTWQELGELLRAGAAEAPPAAVVLAVPDRAVAAVARDLAGWLEAAGAGYRPAHALHLSGALGLEPLAPLARLGSVPEVFHPLAPLTGRETDGERLRGARVTVVHPAGVEPLGPELAAAVGAVPVVWPSPTDEQLALYHAAATLAANAVTALLWAAEDLLQRASYPTEHARPALIALAGGALANAASLGPLPALTGPIARGDVVTVSKHLQALASLAEHARPVPAGHGGEAASQHSPVQVPARAQDLGVDPGAMAISAAKRRYALAARLILEAAEARQAAGSDDLHHRLDEIAQLLRDATGEARP